MLYFQLRCEDNIFLASGQIFNIFFVILYAKYVYVRSIVEYIVETLTTAWYLACVVAPYLLPGFVVAGVLHVIFPAGGNYKRFSHSGLKNVIAAAFYGLMRPESSGRSVGAALDLRRGGASKGSCISFLISSAQSGPDGFLSAGLLISWPFALIRVFFAFVTAIFTGLLVTTSPDEQEHRSHRRHHMFRGGDDAAAAPSSFRQMLGKALFYAFVRMPRYVGRWLILGLLLGAFLMVCVPDDVLEFFQNDTVFSVLFVLVLIPFIHVCATGSVPIAAALLMKGITPGAVLVFLIAGTASNFLGLKALRKSFGWRILLIFTGCILAGSIFFGFVTDSRLPRGLFLSRLPHIQAEGFESPGLVCALSAVVLLMLIVAGHLLHWRHKRELSRRKRKKQAETKYRTTAERHIGERDERGVLQMHRAVRVTMLFSVEDVADHDAALALSRNLRHMEGIDDCEVSFHRKQMMVRGVNLSPEYIIDAVADAGVSATFIRELNPDELKNDTSTQ